MMNCKCCSRSDERKIKKASGMWEDTTNTLLCARINRAGHHYKLLSYSAILYSSHRPNRCTGVTSWEVGRAACTVSALLARTELSLTDFDSPRASFSSGLWILAASFTRFYGLTLSLLMKVGSCGTNQQSLINSGPKNCKTRFYTRLHAFFLWPGNPTVAFQLQV